MFVSKKLYRVIFTCFIIIFSIDVQAARNTENNCKENFHTFFNIKHNTLIIHAALEGPDAIVGGLGCVVRDLTKGLEEFNLSTFSVIPFYEFLEGPPNQKAKIHTLGIIEHEIFGQTTSTEVFVNLTNAQLLLRPAEDYKEITKVVTDRKKIYEPKHNFTRLVFFNSAVAKLADTLSADILHLHGWQTYLAAPLVKKLYNPVRAENQLNPIKTVSTLHILNNEQGVDTSKILTYVGLDQSRKNTVNLTQIGIRESDQITAVSSGLQACFYHPATSYKLDKILSEKKKATTGITNGINYENFNPFSWKNLGVLSKLTQPLTPESITTAKKNAKELLRKYNVIKSKTRPLLLFVGRYSNEKGVEYLEAAIESWIQKGGQAVVMGIYTQDAGSRKCIEHLIKRQKTEPDFAKHLNVYTDLYKDQLAKLSPNHRAQKGKLIRFAADLCFIPSKVEACGLVAMESLSLGTPIFTSWVQGLKDMCIPYKTFHPLLQREIKDDEFNSISFFMYPHDHQATVTDMQHKLDVAYRIITGDEVDLRILSEAQQRMIANSTKFNWLSKNGSIEQYAELYFKLLNN